MLFLETLLLFVLSRLTVGDIVILTVDERGSDEKGEYINGFVYTFTEIQIMPRQYKSMIHYKM